MRILLLIFAFLMVSCSSQQKRIAKWTGCDEDYVETVISKSVSMKTSEIRCGDKVMICKYSSFGFGKCKTPEEAYKGGWTKPGVSGQQ